MQGTPCHGKGLIPRRNAWLCIAAMVFPVLSHPGCSVAEPIRPESAPSTADSRTFFYMTRNGPKVGGFPRTVETLHVRADGRATGTREDDDNVL